MRAGDGDRWCRHASAAVGARVRAPVGPEAGIESVSQACHGRGAALAELVVEPSSGDGGSATADDLPLRVGPGAHEARSGRERLDANGRKRVPRAPDVVGYSVGPSPLAST